MAIRTSSLRAGASGTIRQAACTPPRLPASVLLVSASALLGDDPDYVRPTVDATGPSRVRMSRVPGFDTTDVTLTPSETVYAWEVRVVPATTSPRAEGVLVTTGGAVSAGTPAVATITDDDLLAAAPGDGAKLLMVFGQDAAGNWSGVAPASGLGADIPHDSFGDRFADRAARRVLSV